MRSAIHLGVTASLLLAFSQAPFLHVHDRDPAHEHAHGFAHAHWTGVTTGGLALKASDHESDSRILSWIAGDGKSSVRLVAAMPVAVSIPQPAAQPAPGTELVSHSHDPPWRSTLKSRAPPA